MINKSIITWFSLVAIVVATVPVVNLIVGNGNEPGRLVSAKLFSTDGIESLVSLQLYRKGISSSPEQVVVGKNGWLFLGNFHDHVVDKARGRNEIILKHAKESANNIVSNLQWIESQGIPTIFAIVPNKHSVYPEYLPGWLIPGNDRYLDVVLEITNLDRQRLLELKPALLAEKSSDQLLYYPLDSHWNPLGAWIGYQQIMDNLTIGAANISQIIDPQFEGFYHAQGDLATLLKLEPARHNSDAVDVRITFDQLDSQLCKESLLPPDWQSTGDCISSANNPTDVSTGPVYSRNSQALNNLRVLWLRDSFGNSNSQLFQATFSDLWQVHHRDLFGNQLRDFILREKPEVIIFQVIERLMDASYLDRELF